MNAPRYINPLTDFGFKKIFGNEDVMIAFLNDLLEPQSPIAHVTFIDKDELGVTRYERGVIYDLRCRCEDGSEVIVEMQNKGQLNFSDRILYYLSRSIASQAEKGNTEWDYKLTPVFGIFFINFHLQGFKPQSIRTIQMKVNETGEVFNDNLKAFTLELPDYRKRDEADCKTYIDYWLYNLANMETMTKAIPFQTQRPIFEKVGNISELVNMTEQEREMYNISLDSYRTNLSVMKNERAEGRAEGLAEGVAKGLAKGRAEGLAKGRIEERLANARNLKRLGVDNATISHALGLTLEEVESL